MCNTSGSLSGRSLSPSCAAHVGKSVTLNNTPPPLFPSQSDIHTNICIHAHTHTCAHPQTHISYSTYVLHPLSPHHHRPPLTSNCRR
ncbi:hypothetical protein Hanom_Chr00s000001g01594971 [Helianthus anomalus]